MQWSIQKFFSIKMLANAIRHTKVNNWTSAENIFYCSSANQSYQLQLCKQKLSLASCAHKSYRGFDAILRFFLDPSNIISPLIGQEVLINKQLTTWLVVMTLWNQIKRTGATFKQECSKSGVYIEFFKTCSLSFFTWGGVICQ